MRLKEYRVTPPDGYRYVHPETGHQTKAIDVTTWFQEARNHLQGNNLPIPQDLEAKMEDQLCNTIPPEWCDQVDPNKPYVSTSFSWSDVKAGVDVFISWLTGGAKLVPQDEADRRARICSGCYLNVNVEGCATCHKAASLLTWAQKTQYDDNLKACAVCHCLNKAQVHFPIDALESSDDSARQAMYPSFCWKNKSSDNYKP